MSKHFKLSANDIKPVAEGRGACIATDRITVDGKPVGYMYREEPQNDLDSGWRFFSGDEDQQYMDNPAHHSIYDVNTIANYDPSVIPCLDAAVGMAFEKLPGATEFVEVEGDEE